MKKATFSTQDPTLIKLAETGQPMTPEERAARVANCKHGLLPNWCLPCLNAELDRVTAERDMYAARADEFWGDLDAALAELEEERSALTDTTERLLRIQDERDAALARREDAALAQVRQLREALMTLAHGLPENESFRDFVDRVSRAALAATEPKP